MLQVQAVNATLAQATLQRVDAPHVPHPRRGAQDRKPRERAHDHRRRHQRDGQHDQASRNETPGEAV